MEPLLLAAQAITFSYRDQPTLRGIDLTLAAGEVVALLGPNGSGKSTLIRALLGQLRGSGNIRWQNQLLPQWKPRELAKTVAYLPQSPSFEPGQTVADVLRLGRAPYWTAFGIESPRDARIVQTVAEQLDLLELLNRPIEQLSGGQRQRAFVGRCLVQEPRAILLDEPNTFLDLRHQVSLCQLLKNLAAQQGISVLMASHDLNLAAAYADRVVLLEAGTVAAVGAPAVLTPQLLSHVFGLPMDVLPGSTGKPVFLPRL